ncbi:hypothetical protein A0H81_00107 [Grifola frondosa]|uniref:Uncharacterized protein n=1 Tax=Grifola frondosa TaxID=5627 RepID=A0A1C7MSH2_GRIFR|nr:hypothetical protein A0H81_00107 [Grifola frondosa]
MSKGKASWSRWWKPLVYSRTFHPAKHCITLAVDVVLLSSSGLSKQPVPSLIPRHISRISSRFAVTRARTSSSYFCLSDNLSFCLPGSAPLHTGSLYSSIRHQPLPGSPHLLRPELSASPKLCPS